MSKYSAVLAVLGVAFILVALAPWPSRLSAAAPRPTVAPVSSVAAGKALFRAKGCVSCHIHAAVPAYLSLNVGPNLTVIQRDPEYLHRWLSDPSAIKPGTQMPNLGLSDPEITALVAFLTGSEQ